MYSKKEKGIKNVLLLVCTICAVGQASFAQKKQEKTYDRIKDLPEKIEIVYGTEIIPDEEIALQYVELILKKRYPNVSFDKLKPFEISLIADGKVWEVKVPTDPQLHRLAYYHVRVNKNTGAILNIWVDK